MQIPFQCLNHRIHPKLKDFARRTRNYILEYFLMSLDRKVYLNVFQQCPRHMIKVHLQSYQQEQYLRFYLGHNELYVTFLYLHQLQFLLAHINCLSSLQQVLCLLRLLKFNKKKLLEISHFFYICYNNKKNIPIAGRNIPRGKFPLFVWTIFSASAFVKEYVFGHVPNILK